MRAPVPSRPTTPSRRAVRRGGVAVAGVLLASLAAAPSASAGFVDLGTAFSGAQTTRPTFSFGESGLAFGLHGPSGRGYVVQLFSGDWTPYQALSAPGTGGTPLVSAGVYRDPASSGTPASPAAVWTGDAASPGLYQEFQTLSGVTPPTLNVLPDPRFTSGDVPGDTAIDRGAGFPTVLSRGPEGKGLYVGQSISHDPGEPGWTVATVTDHDVQPGVALGNGSAIWSERRTAASGASYVVVLASYRDGATGLWGTPVERRFPAGSGGTELGIEGLTTSSPLYTGTTTVAFLRTRTVRRPDGTTTRSSAIQTLDLTDETRSWGPLRTLAADRVDPQRSAPRLASLAYGAETPGAVVTWTGSAPGAAAGPSARTVVQASSRPFIGAWSKPEVVSSTTAGASAGLSGVQLAANDGQNVITASWRTRSGGWVARDWEPWAGRFEDRTVQVPGVRTDDVQMTTLGSDTAFAAFDAAKGRADVVVDDSTGPNTTSVGRIVTAGRVGTFAAGAVDGFSKVTDVTWDFGDGTVASGDTVEHTYPTGSYQVTLTATDELGNETVRTGTVYANACGQRRCPVTSAATSEAAVTKARAVVGATAPPKASADQPVARRVRQVRLRGGALRMHVSGPTTLDVHLVHRTKARGSRPAAWEPLRSIHLSTSDAGTVRVPVRGLRTGDTYKVVLGGVRVGASKAPRTVSHTVRAQR